jgi:hypothetical protein
MITKPTTKGRAAALGAVFAVTVTAALTAASFGVSREQIADPACAQASWPYIPAACLAGASDTSVRIVALDRTHHVAIAERFAVAFD